MKVLLINPNFEPPFVYKKGDLRNTPGMPYGLLCLATYLKHNNHNAEIIDTRIEPSMQNILSKAEKADIIGITAMTAQLKDALRICSELKKKFSKPIVFGGIHATLFPEQTCEDPLIDFVVCGEGEETLLELVNALNQQIQTNQKESINPKGSKNPKTTKQDFSKIDGLLFKNNGKVIKNKQRKLIDLNKMPPLDFDIIDVEKYIHRAFISGKTARTLPILSSRGCPHRCAFCFHVLGHDTIYRFKDPEKTIKEIKDLIKKYNITGIKFIEDNFFVNRKRVKHLLEMMLKEKLNLTWSSECRADYFRKGHVDDELLDLMKKSGCTSFTIGAESGSPKMLHIMKKDITVENILFSAKQCNKYSLIPGYSFIFGTPGETKKDIKETIKVIKQIKKLHPSAFGGGVVFRPYPGGNLYEESFKKAGIPKPATLRDWAKNKYLHLMTSKSSIPWCKNPGYTKRVAFYSLFYFFSNRQLKNYIKRNRFLGIGYAIFVYLVRLRWKLSFFALPFDMLIFSKVAKALNYNI